MNNQLQDMEKASQQMKRQAFEKSYLNKHPYAVIDFVDGLYSNRRTQGAWEMWEEAQEHMLQARYDKLSSHDYVLIPAEMSDEIAEAIAHNANCCGGIAYDIYQAIIQASKQYQ